MTKDDIQSLDDSILIMKSIFKCTHEETENCINNTIL